MKKLYVFTEPGNLSNYYMSVDYNKLPNYLKNYVLYKTIETDNDILCMSEITTHCHPVKLNITKSVYLYCPEVN